MTDLAEGSEADRVPLSDLDEQLYRQVHPGWVDNGVPSWQAFTPTRKDNGRLSVTRASMTTAEATYKHYTAVLQLQSAGAWAFTVGEAKDVELDAFDDPQPDTPAHAVVDFGGLSRGRSEKCGKLLAVRAKARGRIYP